MIAEQHIGIIGQQPEQACTKMGTKQISIVKLKIFILLLFLTPVISTAQFVNRKELRKRPKSIDEAIVHLNEVYTDSAKQQIKQFNEAYFIFISSNSIGVYINPYWFQNLVTKTKLAKDFENHGIDNYQNMAVLLYRSFYRKLNNLPVEFDEQVNSIKEYNLHKNDSLWLEKYNQAMVSGYMDFYHVGDTVLKHVGYDYNFFKKAKNTAIVKGVITEKAGNEVKLEILSVDNAPNEQEILDIIGMEDRSNTWIDPFSYQKL